MIGLNRAGEYSQLEFELSRGVHHLDKAADGAVIEPEGVERVAVGFGNGICEDLGARRIKVVLEVDVEEGAEIIVISFTWNNS